MGRRLSIGTAILLCVFFIGCAKQGSNSGDDFKVEYRRDPVKRAAMAVPENDPNTGQKLVKKAQSAIGTPYVYGGEHPGGFDCSGLVKWAYNSVGVNLPRTAREQSVVGQKVQDVEDMRAGDIVAFRHPRRGYHTGIYLGDGKFIHSPRKKTRVRINSLSDPYFSKTLLGARRINMASGENLVAQANERLDKMIAEATNLTISAKKVRARKNQNAHNLLASKSKKAANTLAAKSRSTKKQAKKGETAKNSVNKVASASKQKNMKAAKANNQKPSAQNKKQTTKAVASSNKKAVSKPVVKKQSGKTVSMLNKKTAKQPAKRNRS